MGRGTVMGLRDCVAPSLPLRYRSRMMELIHLQSTAQGRCKPGTQSYISHAFS